MYRWNLFTFSVVETKNILKKKRKISVNKNPCESQSKNYMSYVKKSQLLKKSIKLRIEVAEDPQKHIFKVNFRF